MEKCSVACEYYSLSFSELNSLQQKLVEAAKVATSHSYSPYSHFSVGAAVLLDNGIIVSGSNQENIAYPSGLCAERTAMFSANSQYPESAPIAIAIAAYTNGAFVEKPITPCGACRQVLIESEQRFNHPIELMLYGEKQILLVKNVSSLMPLSFDF
ncbi:MAG: cytidine deaminase [Paludibacteraceae bacterium]|nr:cytidine deaminase [Paludibacteraceae bacterium]